MEMACHAELEVEAQKLTPGIAGRLYNVLMSLESLIH
jgi:hypothetical protein